MAKLFPGIFYAMLATIPGIWVATYVASPRLRELPTAELMNRLLHATPILFLLYGLATLVYGSVVWWGLRLVGLLNLPALVIAGSLPPLVYFGWSVLSYGWEPRALTALLAFWLPTLFASVALWWFTVFPAPKA